MIDFEGFSFWYPGATAAVLQDVDLRVDEGELALLVGLTGSGKSTLLRAVNGLVPRFSGGHVEGRVTAAGRDSRRHAPREYADAVGVVGQNPLSGFVTDTVEEELAYGMEQLALDPAVMRRRVEEMLDLMGIAGLRARALRTLSGGEQQRVAIGAALTCAPRVLVLDEPTSALDPGAAEDALAAVLRLVHDLGLTVLVSEHRLERVVAHADRVAVVEDHRVRSGDPATMLRAAPLAPPVVELGRLLGWEPLPLSVRDARRRAGPLRARLATLQPPAAAPTGTDGREGLVARRLTVRYGSRTAVAGVDVEIRPGEVVALMGRNGSGKSSLLWALHGAGKRASGTVCLDGAPVEPRGRRRSRSPVVLVPQQATDLLYRATVAEECAAADTADGAPDGTTYARFCRLLEDTLVPPATHPRDLSEGQRLALALTVQLGGGASVVLLDEPTRGLDYTSKRQLRSVLRGLAEDGTGVLLATHDVEFVAGTADRVVVLADGHVVADGSTVDVLSSSPMFAPQIAKILAPAAWLTVEQVRDALPGEGWPDV